MLVMAVEAARQMATPGRQITGYFFKEAEFKNAMVIREGGTTETVLQLRPVQNSYETEMTWFTITIFSYDNGCWNICFTATVQVQYQDIATEVDGGRESRLTREEIQRRFACAESCCQKQVDSGEFYGMVKNIGVEYKPSLQLLTDIRWDGDSTSIARVRMDVAESTNCLVHPVVLDAGICLQAIQYTDMLGKETQAYAPRCLHSTWISADGWQDASNLKYLTARTKQSAGVGATASIHALADDGTLLFAMKYLESIPVASEKTETPVGTKLLYGIDWKPQLSYMSPMQLRNWCEADNIPESENNMVDFYPTLEAALGIMVRKVLDKLEDDDLKRAPEFLLKMVAWMRREVENPVHDCQRVPADISDDHLVALLQSLAEEHPSFRLYTEVGTQLYSIIRGETDPLELIFGTGLAEKLYREIFDRNHDFRLKKFISLACHENHSLRILEVGSGTGTMTKMVLDSLQEFEDASGAHKFGEYVFTDLSPSFFEAARNRFIPFESRMQYRRLDLESDPFDQGFEAGAYDMIIAGSVLHAISDLSKVLRNLRKLLKPGGYLVNFEVLNSYPVAWNVGFGVLPGWWLAVEPWRQNGPLVTESRWDSLLKENGFSGNDLTLRDFRDDSRHISDIIISKAVQMTSNGRKDARLLLIINGNSDRQSGVAGLVKEQIFESAAYRETKVCQFANLRNENPDRSDVAVLLIELDTALLYTISEGNFVDLQDLVAKVQRLLWVTGSGTQDGGDPSPPHRDLAKGFLRSIRSEDEDRQFVTLSVEDEMSSLSNYAKIVTDVLHTSFQDIKAPEEVDLIFRDGLIQSGRLYEESRLSEEMSALIAPQPRSQAWKPGPPLQLAIETSGVLDTLEFVEDASHDDVLQPEEVEIEAKAWGVSFRDLTVALGHLTGQTLGSDCAGVVRRAGPGSVFNSGDRIVLSSPGCMRMYPRGTSDQAIKIPDDMSFEVAASLMTPGITSYYGLIRMARLRKGDKILIHSAAGATGQLAIWIAKMVGAEIFATVGYNNKRRLLIDEFGIPEENIFYSRNTSFAEGIMRITNGCGVDVVLNSLSGDGLYASWECMAPNGRFIEIGKTDIVSNSSLPMSGFSRNVSFFAVDTHHLRLSNPPLASELISQVMGLFASGKIRHPSPLNIYPVSEVEHALRFMQSGRNTGRTIISINDADVVRVRHSNLTPCLSLEKPSLICPVRD